jgi:hypothetical protein
MENPKPKGQPTLEEELRLKIKVVANGAAADDLKMLDEILTKARSGQRESGYFVVTPPMAATLFLEHNPHNRDWAPAHSVELERQMRLGQWSWNNATIGFYRDGCLGDGGHRCAAAALAGFTFEVIIIFGMEREAIVTVDSGKARYARDAMKLGGMSDSPLKETMVSTAAAYRIGAGEVLVVKSKTEILRAARNDNDSLDRAIEIGSASRAGMAGPILKDKDAAIIAYLLIKTGWPEDRIREKLTYFQSGQAKDGLGESSPFFVVAKILSDVHAKANDKLKLTRLKEIGTVVFAMVQSELGVTAVQKKQVLESVKKGKLPDPRFPRRQLEAAE